MFSENILGEKQAHFVRILENVVEKTDCLSAVCALIVVETGREDGQAKLLLYRNFLFKSNVVLLMLYIVDQTKDSEQYFHVVLFIKLYKVVLS